MRKKGLEYADHLLLHYEFTRDFWGLFIMFFGIAWLMARSVRDLSRAWNGARIFKR